MNQQGPTRPPDWFSNFLLESAQADLDVFRVYELERRELENENEMLKALLRDKEVQLSDTQTALDQHSMELSNAEERIKNLMEKLKTKIIVMVIYSSRHLLSQQKEASNTSCCFFNRQIRAQLENY